VKTLRASRAMYGDRRIRDSGAKGASDRRRFRCTTTKAPHISLVPRNPCHRVRSFAAPDVSAHCDFCNRQRMGERVHVWDPCRFGTFLRLLRRRTWRPGQQCAIYVFLINNSRTSVEHSNNLSQVIYRAPSRDRGKTDALNELYACIPSLLL